ncbi:MAG TPA: hypothetical protein VGO80_05615 [Solirubrobacteraceae bacterium]|jgi:hypothetical protein|nr:hypothetical protein [Solirubrobacteraceae bacterium]
MKLGLTTRLTAAVLLTSCALTGSADGAVPSQEITSAGPLTSVALGDELSCQVAYSGDARFELFPSSVKPGDCGTFVFVAGTLFAPNFAAHDSSSTAAIAPSTAFTPVSQAPVSGSGTSASPFKVTTVADAGASGVRVTQVDAYVAGQESYRTDTTLLNGGAGPAEGVLYRAGDCYLQDSDTGFGFVDPAAGAVGCSINANNSPAGRIEQWYPITRSNQYMQAQYSEVWAHIGTHAPFPNTTRATESVDNGAGISWTFALAAGASATYSHYTTFSPRGVAGPPPTAPPPPALPPAPGTAFGPNGLLDAPPRNRCLSRRYFRIRVRKRFQPILVGVTIKMPKTTRVLKRKPWSTIVDLRGLAKGRFAVKITALTTTGKTIKGTRHYRTCRGRLKGGKPPL